MRPTWWRPLHSHEISQTTNRVFRYLWTRVRADVDCLATKPRGRRPSFWAYFIDPRISNLFIARVPRVVRCKYRGHAAKVSVGDLGWRRALAERKRQPHLATSKLRLSSSACVADTAIRILHRADRDARLPALVPFFPPLQHPHIADCDNNHRCAVGAGPLAPMKR